MVDDIRPELLLGENMEDLGIIKLNPKRKMETAVSSHKVNRIEAEAGGHWVHKVNERVVLKM